MFDLIIIGGGPAGIAAGIYSARKYLKTLLLTKDFEGQIFASAKVENYPGFKEISGVELANFLKEHLFKIKTELKDIIEIKEGEVVNKISKKEKGFEVQTLSNENFWAKSVIIATGASPRKLEIPGAEDFEGRGVSFCETCDGVFFKDKRVLVVGSGNAGLEAIEELLNYASEVWVLEISNKIVGDKMLFERIKKKGAKVILNAEPKEILGGNFVEKLIYFDKIEKKEKEIKIDGIFVKIGQKPNTEFLKEFLKLNDKEEIIVDPLTLETSIKGVFAAGDATNIIYKQYVIAAGEGAKAAISAYNYIKNLKNL